MAHANVGDRALFTITVLLGGADPCLRRAKPNLACLSSFQSHKHTRLETVPDSLMSVRTPSGIGRCSSEY